MKLPAAALPEPDDISGARPRPTPGAPPTRIGRFEVRRTLGAGGMGAVEEAWDPSLGRIVAVKRLLPRRDGAARALLLREARAMARVASPWVVPVYEVGEDGDEVFIAMERVRGVTLAQWLDAAPREPREVLPVLVDVARGLAAAHDAGVVHRDFKPSNVIVGDDGRARVLDFGIAHAGTAETPSRPPAAISANDGDGDATLSGSVMGTAGYMSPEHFGGGVSPASDQWSFGATAYRALFGALPYPPGPVLAMMLAVAQPPPPPPPHDDLDPRAVAAVLRALDPSPAARFPSMHALLEVLAPIAAQRPSLDPTRFIAQRRRALSLLAGLAALNLTVVAAHTRLTFDAGVETALSSSATNLLALSALSWRYRRALFATERNRGVIALFALTLGSVTAHRAYAWHRGHGLVDTLRVDAIFVAALWSLGAVLMEPWLAGAAAAMLAYAALTVALPHAALPGFALVMVCCVGLAMRSWRRAG